MFDAHDLTVLIRSGTPLIQIETHEEQRLEETLRHVMAEVLRPLWRWSITDGLSRLDMHDPDVPACNDSGQLLEFMQREERRGIWLLFDFHPYLRYAMNLRRLRELALGNGAARQTIILAGAGIDLPDELNALVTRFEVKLPDDDALQRLIREEAFDYSREHDGRRVEVDSRSQRLLVQHLRGLTLNDARGIVRRVIYDDGAIGPKDVTAAQRAKFELLGRGGLLQFQPDAANFEDVAGLSKMKAWLAPRRAVFLADSIPEGLDPPRGLLLLGVQGCGKSLAAKACAGGFGVPLLRLDFGSLYNKYHGETERNLRQALDTAEAMSPCVLWCDEIEKGLANSDADDGVSRRVLGTLLTWMSERRRPVFLVATANDISRLPPEFLRKGRFDELFFVDLPNADSRREAFRIHLQRRQQKPERYDLDALAVASDGFSGAEIEQAIVAGLYAAFADGRPLSASYITRELANTRPLSVLMAEKIANLRDWARERCVAAD